MEKYFVLRLNAKYVRLTSFSQSPAQIFFQRALLHLFRNLCHSFVRNECNRMGQTQRVFQAAIGTGSSWTRPINYATNYSTLSSRGLQRNAAKLLHRVHEQNRTEGRRTLTRCSPERTSSKEMRLCPSRRSSNKSPTCLLACNNNSTGKCFGSTNPATPNNSKLQVHNEHLQQLRKRKKKAKGDDGRRRKG